MNQKLRVVYTDNPRGYNHPQLLTEDGLDLCKIIPIQQIHITYNPFEAPDVTLVLGLNEMECELVPQVTVVNIQK